MGNKIAVYAICKNEEAFVDRWYESMKEADAIYVLDTGSTDNTIDKLLSHNIIVNTCDFNGNFRFDDARNVSLAMVGEEYNILVSTDLDEVFEPGWANILRQNWIDGFHERCCYKYTWSHNPEKTFAYTKIHSRNFIWKYPVHEYVYEKEGFKLESKQVLNLFNAIHLHHYPDNNKSRGSYMKLIKLRAEENPRDTYSLIYLGREYYFYKEYKSMNEVFHKLIDVILLEKKDDLVSVNTHEHNDLILPYAYKMLGLSELALGDRSHAIESFNKSIKAYPGYLDPYIAMAKLQETLGNYRLAIVYLKEGIKNQIRQFSWLEDATSFGSLPIALLSEYLWKIGDKSNAISLASCALNIDKDNKIIKDGLSKMIANTSKFDIIKNL